MLFRTRKVVAQTAPDRPGGQPAGYQAQTALVARPDTAAIGRVLDLQAAIGRGLAGHSGAIVGHDNSAPERTLTGPVASRAAGGPSDAIAAVQGLPAGVPIGQPEYADAGGTNSKVDPRSAILWNRMQNS
jgi:hypothetical protein